MIRALQYRALGRTGYWAEATACILWTATHLPSKGKGLGYATLAMTKDVKKLAMTLITTTDSCNTCCVRYGLSSEECKVRHHVVSGNCEHEQCIVKYPSEHTDERTLLCIAVTEILVNHKIVRH